MDKSSFSVPNVRSFYTEVEQPILKFWQENGIFQKSIDQRPEDNSFVFYDGPPFVTGLPHYGHLLGSIIKDIVPRYQTMKGKRVERVWGWDCHGVPIEEMVERKYETKSRREVEEKIGIKKFTDECAAYVSDTSSEWNWYIDRIARWVDMEKPYRTMDIEYMETVMWVFKQFYEKDLLYKGKRVSLYCTRCGTPLSSFEIAMDNSYRDLEDPSVYVKFPLKYYKTGVGVGAVIENEKGEIMMIRRNEPGRDPVMGVLGGKCDPEDGSVLDTVKREVMEEVGCEVESHEYFGYSMDIFEGRLFKTHHFKVKVKGEPKVTDEAGLNREIKWFKPSKLPWNDMHIPTRNGLKDILEGTSKVAELDLSKEPNFDKPQVSVIAWTTTPWTLSANTALVVSADEDYVTCKVGDEYVIMAAERVENVLEGQEYKIIDTYKGKELIGNSYEPLYDYFEAGPNDYKVYNADFVSMSDGSGIVHMAPGFGEDDTNLGQELGLSMHETLDEEGKLIDAVRDYKGIYFKKADDQIIEDLTKEGKMLRSERITHSYPICYRCSTPLVYKAQDSWYVDLQKIKPELHKTAEQINWVPGHVKEGLFKHTIETSPDWGLTRTRFWATPMPIWQCNNSDCNHMEVLGSRAEIEERSGKPVKNLHRPYIDEHTWKCTKCEKGTMTRVPEVVDVWLESASMPYAQYHYPFENKEKFERNFPGDFIIEYVGQVRAWFNVMHRVATILFDQPAFKNVIATGVIQGTDGRKMSKSYKNYPDPKATIEKYGGDSFRTYIAGSVLAVGENLNVSEEGIAAPIKEILLPLMNIYKYFALYANQHGFDATKCEGCPHKSKCETESNILDKWVKLRVKQAAIEMDKAIAEYQLPKAVAQIKPLIDDVSTWYIRRSRDRFVSGDTYALNTLYEVIVQMIKLFAPIIPFTTEFIYQELKKGTSALVRESVHLEMYPDKKTLSEEEKTLLETMQKVRNAVSLGQNIRVDESLPLRQPLSEAYISSDTELSKELLEIITAELNVSETKSLTEMPSDKSIISRKDTGFEVGINIEITPELKEQGVYRDVYRSIQAFRKNNKAKLGENIKISIYSSDKNLKALIEREKSKLEEETVTSISLCNEQSEKAKRYKIGLEKVEMSIE